MWVWAEYEPYLFNSVRTSPSTSSVFFSAVVRSTSIICTQEEDVMRNDLTLRIIIAVFLAFSGARAALAVPYAYAQIDVPFANASDTVIAGINNHGHIVGWYSDASFQTHGFFRSGSQFVPIDVALPTASNTRALGINDNAQIVGVYNIGPTQQLHGFLFDQSNFTFIDVPFQNAANTQVAGINNQGLTVGDYFSQNTTRGFLRSAGGFTPVDLPTASVTSPSGINDRGQIVGQFLDAAFDSHGFLLDGGNVTAIDAPFLNVVGTTAFGINEAQQIVGSYFTSDFISNVHGFFADTSGFTPIDVPFPGGFNTAVRDINDAGVVAGVFSNHTGNHGFIATPAAAIVEPAPLLLVGLGLVLLSSLRRHIRHRRPCVIAIRNVHDRCMGLSG
jgi:hypothetical protein